MWKGIKKALGHRAKAQKTSTGQDSSTRSTCSAGQSSHGGALFPLDMTELDAMLTADATSKQQHQSNQQQPAPAAALTWAQLQQQLQQQHAVQALLQQTEDSTSKRRAAAMQKRVNNSMLNPSTCMYQIKALLSLSTLFEHKLQRDTLQALQQQPSNLVSSVAGLAQAPQPSKQPPQPSLAQQQQYGADGAALEQLGFSSSGPVCGYCQGLSGSASAGTVSQGSCCSCLAGGGPAALRTPSATAASTAHVALLLASWGYRVIVRKVLHSKAYWTKSMDNTFIVALDSSSGNHVEYIVDPHFQEAFNVGVMSDNYRAVWQALPRVFVGMPCQLQSAVQLLCEEVELSFLEAGRPCPPWRGWAATINRWMSDQFIDILVPETGASPEEVAEYMSRCTQLAAAACGGPGSSASSASTGTRGSSTGVSTCSPLGGNASTQRLGDKVHVSSVLSSVSGARERRVPQPLQQQVGFTAEDECQQQQQQQQQQREPQHTPVFAADELPVEAQQERTASSSSDGGVGGVGSAGVASLLQQPSDQQQQQQQQQQECCFADGDLPQRSFSSSSSSGSGSSSAGGSSGPSSSRGRSLLTAQMQFRQQQQQQFAQGGGVVLHPNWAAKVQQQQQLLLLQQQQQQQQLLMQQLQSGQVVQTQQQAQQQLHQMQLQFLLQQQQQQQPAAAAAALGACAPLLPVVHTVRPCGGVAPADKVPAAAAAMHAAALQQLVPVAQRQQLQQQQQQQQQVHGLLAPQQQPLHQQQVQQQQVGQQPALLQLHASMHSSPEDQPKLLRLIPRNNKAA